MLKPVLSAYWDEQDSFTIDGYKRHDGYDAAKKALGMDADAVIQLIKDSG
ncbi:MAG: NADH-quinone oxidoreductase subunit F, partial [Candidatus Nanopelagicaceae bacterium]